MINKIIHGDCYEVLESIEDGSVDMVCTDPPYLFNANGGSMAKRRQYTKDIESKDLDKGIDIGETLDIFARKCKAINIATFCNKAQMLDIMLWIEKNDARWQLITWNKTNPTPLVNNNYLPDTEYCFHIWKDTPLYGSYQTKKKFYVTPNGQNTEVDHPTVKPLHIIENLIINATQEGDIVLDPFAGSGTTAIAAWNLNRNSICIELDEEYYDLSVKRFDNHTRQGKLF